MLDLVGRNDGNRHIDVLQVLLDAGGGNGYGVALGFFSVSVKALGKDGRKSDSKSCEGYGFHVLHT
jgi:hypothetical protein